MEGKSDMAMPKTDRRAGPKVGSRTGFTLIANVLPGHEKALRESLAEDQADPAADAALDEIGTLHEFRFVLIDDDRRIMFCSSFDGDWDKYVEDFIRTAIGGMIDKTLQHAEGWVGIKDPGASEWLLAHGVPAVSYKSAYPQPSVKQVWKALAVQEAFQQALDDPAAEEALQHPALKPMLDLAAD